MSRPALVVVAVGGNAVSPARADTSFGAERARIAEAMHELAALAWDDRRLLLVHGNGPQVGRLLADEAGGATTDLDILVAQTQGELGYLMSEALDGALGTGAAVAVVTRALVDPGDPAFERPSKPVGRVLADRPPGVPASPTPDGRGWRRVVASPRPVAVVELEAIRALLDRWHVVAGGGGGVPLARRAAKHTPCAAVVDKDHVSALLAVALDADALVFVTDVPCVMDDFGTPRARPIARMTVDEARARLAGGAFAGGSMQPKVESALDFVSATGRTAVITTPGQLHDALAQRAGTSIVAGA